MSLIRQMRENDEMTERDKDICRYVLENPEKIESLSARELGLATFTSAASVTRFCQKLGVKGFPEFKIKFVSELRDGLLEEDAETVVVSEHENTVTMIRKVTKIEQQAIEETRKELSYSQMVRISRMISEAAAVDFYAYDMNVYLAQYGCSLFYHAGKHANVYSATNMQGLRALMPSDGHISILFSHTGESKRLAEIIKILKKKGGKVIVITSGKDRTLAKAADEFIYAAGSRKVEELWGAMFFSSGKYILDILYGMEFSSRYKENLELNMQYESVGRKHLWGLERDV